MVVLGTKFHLAERAKAFDLTVVYHTILQLDIKSMGIAGNTYLLPPL